MASIRGDYVLEEEKYSLSQIEQANKEKDDLLRKAKDLARKETVKYDEDKRNECMQKITDLTSNVAIIDEITEKSKKDIEEINSTYEKNKAQVIDYLFKNVLTVEFEVPDVVKGCFEEKFGISDKE